MGLVQVSKNPFQQGKNRRDLGEFLLGENGVLAKYRADLEATRISLREIKYISERGLVRSKQQFQKQLEKLKPGERAPQAQPRAVGFRWSDFVAQYGKKNVSGIDMVAEAGSERVKELTAITEKHYDELSRDERAALDGISISAWDLLQANSGGHHDISQVSGLNFLPRGFRGGGFVRELHTDIAEAMQDARLE